MGGGVHGGPQRDARWVAARVEDAVAGIDPVQVRSHDAIAWPDDVVAARDQWLVCRH
jgi:hypothetical protein